MQTFPLPDPGKVRWGKVAGGAGTTALVLHVEGIRLARSRSLPQSATQATASLPLIREA